jgi:hypothetical protein
MTKAVFLRSLGPTLFALVLVLPPNTQAGPVAPPPLLAMPITFAWNPASDPAVRGYALYHGPTNQPATNRVDAGTSNSTTLQGLRANTGYRFYAVSYNAAGVESIPSNELQLVVPALSRLQLARQADGSMRLSGKAAPGTVCTVQFTPSLNPAAWQALAQATADQLGNVIAIDATASQAPSRFYRVTLGAPPPLLGAMGIQRQSSGNVLLSGTAPPGATCRVQYSSSLDANDWQTLAYLTADSEGNLAALDYTARFANRRFYRMVLP